jgi:aconitase B
MILKEEAIELNILEITTILASCRTDNPTLKRILQDMQEWVNQKAKRELEKDKSQIEKRG